LCLSPHQNSACTCAVPHTCNMPQTSHSSWFVHPNNIWWLLQIINLLVSGQQCERNFSWYLCVDDKCFNREKMSTVYAHKLVK
jgi:hypothetical protein